MVRPYTVGKPFRFWCQKILPLVYDDSLSYYELLNKVVEYLNKNVNNINALGDAFDALQTYVQNYFNNLDVQQEIDAKLDEMVQDGTLFGSLFTEMETITLTEQTVENVAFRNVVINFNPTLLVGNDCSFYNCDFVCSSLVSGNTPAIKIIGKNSLFNGCTFTGVTGSTTLITQEKTAFNSKFIECSFDGSFKNPLNLGSTKNNLVDGCYFAPLIGFTSSNVYQLKLSYAGDTLDESYNGTGFSIIKGCYFDGLESEYHTAIDCYCGGHDILISDCIFYQNSGVTIKTDWRDLDETTIAGTNINYTRYSHDIKIDGCLFYQCEQISYIANTQYSTSNIGITVPNNIIFASCLFLDSGGFTASENIPTSAESTLMIQCCLFHNTIVNRVVTKDVTIDGCTIVINKKITDKSGIIYIGHAGSSAVKCNSISISNTVVKDLNADNSLVFLYQQGYVNEISITNTRIQISQPYLFAGISSIQIAKKIFVDNCTSNAYLLSFNPTKCPAITVIKNCYFTNYAISRGSSSSGYGSGYIYIFNTICEGKNSITNPASQSGWVEEDHVFNCVAIPTLT